MNTNEDIQAVRDLLGSANPVTNSEATGIQLADARAAVTAKAALPPPPPPLDPTATGRSPVKWRLAVAAVAACAALIVGVVIARTGNDTTTAGNPVLASYATTSEEGTTRAAFDVTVNGTTVTGEGAGSFVTGEASGSATLPAPFGDVSFVSTGDTIYVQVPESFRAIVGKPWAEIPADDFMALQQLFLEDVGLSAPFNPADMLNFIKGVSGEVTEVGPDTVRGEPTTKYQARIELAKVAAAMGEDAESALSDANFDLTLPADIWIDSEGRLRKITMAITSPIEATATFELWDFGTAVDATPPPADQVGDIGALLSGFLGADD